MSDVVERLRNENYLWTVPGALRHEAADEISRLRAALEKSVRIVEALKAEVDRWSFQDTATRLASELLDKAARDIAALQPKEEKK